MLGFISGPWRPCKGFQEGLTASTVPSKEIHRQLCGEQQRLECGGISDTPASTPSPVEPRDQELGPQEQPCKRRPEQDGVGACHRGSLTHRPSWQRLTGAPWLCQGRGVQAPQEAARRGGRRPGSRCCLGPKSTCWHLLSRRRRGRETGATCPTTHPSPGPQLCFLTILLCLL